MSAITESSSRRQSFRFNAAIDRLKSSWLDGISEQSLVEEEAANGHEADLPYTEKSSLLLSSTLDVEQNENEEVKNIPKWQRCLGKVPAVCLIFMFHLMIGVAFGVSYFPISWRPPLAESDPDDSEEVVGPFPIPGKQALGIRMFLFSTIVGQLAFVRFSKFANPIGLQMVENVPFCHALAIIVIRHMGYGREALSTLMCLFGLSSILVGVIFFYLGKMELGRVVYFFPTHVLVGCIGGIGVFLAKTGIEVTTDDHFASLANHLDLIAQVFGFELSLRLLKLVTRDETGKQKFPLLTPIFFCAITPAFYVLLAAARIPPSTVPSYFFPQLDLQNEESSTFVEEAFRIWTVINPTTLSFRVIWDCVPTMVALSLFSLIHVPINIPAFAVSTNVDSDMNNELIAHGYSNLFVGCFGGLQNYMAYTQSILYDRSGGKGKASGIAVAAVTVVLFCIGPTVASYVPRCMAGTLLVHVGIDLFLEGVYDSYGKFDRLEYAGIWLITLVMTGYGMDAAMIAGVIAAVSTYAVQSITYPVPIRGVMSGATLRSSNHTRNQRLMSILDSPATGRQRCLVVQLQGHLFFGNMANLTESIDSLLSDRQGMADETWIVLMDFSLVLGIDSSAAQALVKIRDALKKKFFIDPCIFVSGSQEGFPCEFPLSSSLEAETDSSTFSGSRVFNSLDEGLSFAEDSLISRQNAFNETDKAPRIVRVESDDSGMSGERQLATFYMRNLCDETTTDREVSRLISYFKRESYDNGDTVWLQGSEGDCAKLVVRGDLISHLENEAGTSETISTGCMIGELGLVSHIPRMSSVVCLTDDTVLYSLSRDDFQKLLNANPRLARLIDMICIRYLTNRVQHVSNRIFETRCLPI